MSLSLRSGNLALRVCYIYSFNLIFLCIGCVRLGGGADGYNPKVAGFRAVVPLIVTGGI